MAAATVSDGVGAKRGEVLEAPPRVERMCRAGRAMSVEMLGWHREATGSQRTSARAMRRPRSFFVDRASPARHQNSEVEKGLALF
mmetsp:Transcript_118324/g.342072  ORF Transcript_118324/g.342072 Transcript_118324/m.342072 type:complete len:85 (-) Transcript_118324:61-315(-)